jgi:arylsulfatase A-like enzyme
MLTNFYSSPTSTPSRGMLFTGKDYHPIGIGTMGGWFRPEQKGNPFYTGVISEDTMLWVEALQANGYHTMITGKWDIGEKPPVYPNKKGFTETRTLLLGGDVHYSNDDGTMLPSQHGPTLKKLGIASPYEVNGKIIAKFPKKFYSTEYYTDQAIDLLEKRPADKPFYLSLCYTAAHTPLQAPAEVTAKYIDVYAKGWDVLRKERFERQKAIGLVSKDAPLPERPSAIPAWDTLPPEKQKVQAKTMAVYAAMLDVADQNVGRLITYLKAKGLYENTVIFLMSDNGGTFGLTQNPSLKQLIKEHYNNSYENIGNGTSFIGFDQGWSTVENTPFTDSKATTFEGGIHVFGIVNYPKSKISGVQYDCLHSIMDIGPTVLDMAHVKYPDTYHGKPNPPMQGVSMAEIFDGFLRCNPDRWLAWELDGCKGVIQGNWKLSQTWDDAKNCWNPHWFLYNLAKDPFELNDLSQTEPKKFADLLELYKEYAKQNGVVEVDPCPPAGAPAAE